jgi:hypothetical protein
MAYVIRPSCSFVGRYFELLLKFSVVIFYRHEHRALFVSDVVCGKVKDILCLVTDSFESGNVKYTSADFRDDMFSNQVVGKKVLVDDVVVLDSVEMIPVDRDGDSKSVFELEKSALCNGLRFVLLFVSSDGFVVDSSVIKSEMFAKSYFSSGGVEISEALVMTVKDSVYAFCDEFIVSVLGYVRTFDDGFPPVIVSRVDLGCGISEIEEKAKKIAEENGVSLVDKRVSLEEYVEDGSLSGIDALKRFFVSGLYLEG